MKTVSNRVCSSILAIFFVLLLSACASTEVDETAGWDLNKLYAEAKSAAQANDYDKAVEYYNKLEGRAAGTMLAQQAQIEAAHALYKQGNKEEAVAKLDRFMQLHPGSPALDYALYLKGTIYFSGDIGYFGSYFKQDLSQNDQLAAKDAFQVFNELITRFPNSRYTPDARARMVFIVNSIAQSEVNIARYYYNRGAYVAAINRAQQAVRNHQQAPALEEALYIIYMAYEKMGMQDLSADAKRVMDHNFPNSQLHQKGLPSGQKWWSLW
ncbi:MAG: outer membrane protein assembly factor BamD [Saezia sp.]